MIKRDLFFIHDPLFVGLNMFILDLPTSGGTVLLFFAFWGVVWI